MMSDGTNLSTEPDHRFRTAGPGPMTFLVFGDSGSGSPNQQEITKALVKERPNFIIHVGDMAYEEGTHRQFQANYFEYYQSIMRRAPIFPSAGTCATVFRDGSASLKSSATRWRMPTSKESCIAI